MCRSREVDRKNYRRTVENIVTKLIADPDKYKLGKTMIFFRAGQVAYMEKLRSDKRNAAVLMIQKSFRGWLARRKYIQIRRTVIKIQTMARGFLARRYDWCFFHNVWKSIKIFTIKFGVFPGEIFWQFVLPHCIFTLRLKIIWLKICNCFSVFFWDFFEDFASFCGLILGITNIFGRQRQRLKSRRQSEDLSSEDVTENSVPPSLLCKLLPEVASLGHGTLRRCTTERPLLSRNMCADGLLVDGTRRPSRRLFWSSVVYDDIWPRKNSVFWRYWLRNLRNLT